MANQLQAVIDKLLAQGLMALREQAFMPLLVNRAYEEMAGAKGSTIDVPIPSAITSQDVTPGATSPSTADLAPTSVPIPLDQWKEAAFFLTDKDRLEAENGILPMQASEAIKTLANDVNRYILGLYVGIYGYHGTAGLSPFGSDTTDATGARKILNNQLAPMDPRYMVLDPDAEANALNLRAFQDASFGGGADVIINAELQRKLGFFWFMHQLIPTHIAGTGASIQTAEAGVVGVTAINVDTGTGTLVVGDIITFAGHSQTYAVTTAVADVSSGTVNISPALQATVADNAAVTVKGDHVVNFAFHRDAIAFATRPLIASSHPSSLFSSEVDPSSGLTLRLEVTREHKRDRYSFDILYGGQLVRAQLATRLVG